MATSVNGRVQVLDAPIMSPGVCCLCGSAGGDHRKFIDFGKQLDWYGNVYFCSECIREVLTVLEYVSVDNFDKLHDSYRELSIRHEKLTIQYEAVKNAIVVLGSTSDISSSGESDDSSDESSIPSDPVSEDVGVSELAEGRDSETEQPSGDERLDEFFDSSDFDNDDE